APRSNTRAPFAVSPIAPPSRLHFQDIIPQPGGLVKPFFGWAEPTGHEKTTASGVSRRRFADERIKYTFIFFQTPLANTHKRRKI
ncbi:MAG: hypothetical protein SO063_02255, partial [Eubacteriales bacterium]|nr:hypothetical protein [Eubacteriales bacterium]